MLISFTSVAGSPGASTAALAVGSVWPRPAVIAECDPLGGESLALTGEARPVGRRGLRDVMLAARVMPLAQAMWQQLILLPDSTGQHWVLPGLEDPRDADHLNWQQVADAFTDWDAVAPGVEIDVVADCGRLRAMAGPRAVLACSDLVVVFVRSDLRSVLSLHRAAAAVRAETGHGERGDDGLVAVVVGPGRPYPRRDVERQLASVEIPLVGELPWDTRASEIVPGRDPAGRRKAAGSPLVRDAHDLARTLGRRAWERHDRLAKVDRTAPRPASPQGAPATSHPVERLVAGPARPVPAPTPAVSEGARHGH